MGIEMLLALVVFGVLIATPAVMLAYGCGVRDERERQNRASVAVASVYWELEAEAEAEPIGLDVLAQVAQLLDMEL